MKTIQKRKCNNIKVLKLDDGYRISEHSDIMKEIAILIIMSRPTNFNHVLNLIPTLVNDYVNDSLIKGVTNEDIKKNLFDMYPLKAQEVNGMTLFFFQKY